VAEKVNNCISGGWQDAAHDGDSRFAGTATGCTGVRVSGRHTARPGDARAFTCTAGWRWPVRRTRSFILASCSGPVYLAHTPLPFIGRVALRQRSQTLGEFLQAARQ
jgi:hypothetical protein